MSPSTTLEVIAIVIPSLGVPTLGAMLVWGKKRTVGAFRGAVEDVVDDRVPGLVKIEVAPLVDQIADLAKWREHVTHEISPNSGTSMKDKIDALYDAVIDQKDPTKIQRKMDEAKAEFINESRLTRLDAREGQFS